MNQEGTPKPAKSETFTPAATRMMISKALPEVEVLLERAFDVREGAGAPVLRQFGCPFPGRE